MARAIGFITVFMRFRLKRRAIVTMSSLTDQYVDFPTVCPSSVEIFRRVGCKITSYRPVTSLVWCRGPLQLVQALARKLPLISYSVEPTIPRFPQMYRFLLTSDPSLTSWPHIHVELIFSQLFPRTKDRAILHGKPGRKIPCLLFYLPACYTQTPCCLKYNLIL